MAPPIDEMQPPLSVAEQEELAVSLILDAWRSGIEQGVSPQALAAVAIATGFAELVGLIGQDAAVDVAAKLPEQIRSGALGPHRAN